MATSKDFTSAKIADGPTEQKLYDTALSTISAVTKLPLVKVNREKFLSRQFANSPHLEHILAHGPQSVYTAEALQKKAHKIVRSNTTKTAVTSFVSGLPTNPLVMVPAGGSVLRFIWPSRSPTYSVKTSCLPPAERTSRRRRRCASSSTSVLCSAPVGLPP